MIPEEDEKFSVEDFDFKKGYVSIFNFFNIQRHVLTPTNPIITLNAHRLKIQRL
jgi:hypothetical protein